MKKRVGLMKQRLLARLLEEKEMKLKGGLYHRTQIKLAYNSNRIEGSRLSEEQTRYIYETNTITMEPNEAASVDDIIETVNHFFCFDYMLANVDGELSEGMIKEFHRLLKGRTSNERKEWFRVGDYKTRPNMVGDMATTAPAEVGREVGKLLSDIIIKGRLPSRILSISIIGLRVSIPFRMVMDEWAESLCLRNV